MGDEYMDPKSTGEYVASCSIDIKIDEEGIQTCAADIVKLIKSNKLTPDALYSKFEVHPQRSSEKAVDWVFVTSTLNFSFWAQEGEPQYKVSYKDKTYSGYLSLCAAMDKAVDKGIPITDPHFYSKISLDELTQLLMGDSGIPCPLMEDRLKNIQEVGKVLIEKYNGSFYTCLKNANNSSQALLRQIVNDFDCYKDVATYNGKKIAIYKRAQILIADLWCLFQGKDAARFDDIDTITMFADYRVPQTLQSYGVMKYSDRLINRLNTNEIMENGDKDEIEIRACSIHAVTLITDRVKEIVQQDPNLKGSLVNAVLIDQFLWGYRREHAAYMKKFPFHKVRCIYY